MWNISDPNLFSEDEVTGLLERCRDIQTENRFSASQKLKFCEIALHPVSCQVLYHFLAQVAQGEGIRPTVTENARLV